MKKELYGGGTCHNNIREWHITFNCHWCCGAAKLILNVIRSLSIELNGIHFECVWDTSRSQARVSVAQNLSRESHKPRSKCTVPLGNIVQCRFQSCILKHRRGELKGNFSYFKCSGWKCVLRKQKNWCFAGQALIIYRKILPPTF